MSEDGDRALKLARRKRNVTKQACEHYIDDIEKDLSKLDNLDELSKATLISTLAVRKDSLFAHKVELLQLDEDYLSLIEEDNDFDVASAESSQLKCKIDCTIGLVNRAVESAKVIEQASQTKTPISVKLPKLEIKKFNGNPSQWRSFWDSFQAAVGKHSDIEDVQKFNFLKGLLEGKAAMAISGLELSSENYKNAVSLLSDRFGSKQVVITHHMDTLLQINPVKAGSEVKQLRAVYDKIEVNVRGLQSLGIKSDQYGCLLVPVIMSKVPDDIRLIILRQFSSENWTFEVLLKCFKQELEAREKCEAVSRSSKSKEIPERSAEKSKAGERKHPGHNGGGTSRTLITPGSKHPSKESNIKCTFCRGDHTSVSCDIVSDIDTRWKFVKRQHLCFLCLAKNHGLWDCKSTKNCRQCSEKHHESLCKGRPSTGLIAKARQSTLLQTAKVKAINPKDKQGGCMVRVVFDLGSNDSFVTQNLKNKLKLPSVGTHKMSISGFGGTSKGSKDYDMTCLNVKSRFGGDSFPLSAMVVPKITSSPLNPSVNLDYHEHLASLDLADDFSSSFSEISILIGVDQYHRFVSGETERSSSGPVATKSVFGWLVSGPIHGEAIPFSNSFLLSSDTLSVDESLSRFWDLESLGIHDEVSEDATLTAAFKESIVHNGKRYEVPLPRKDVHPDLKDNLSVAKQRLFGLKKKFQHNPELFERYDQYFCEQLENDIIEKVDPSDQGSPGWTHYLPHHGVIRENRETTKLRVVFDGSCKSNGNPSLNQCLETGPSLNPELFDILLRFRLFPIVLVSDIEKAFHMISVRPEDRDVLRFVWFDPMDKSRIVVYRQRRVLMGLNASPFILTATVHNHLEKHTAMYPKHRNLVEGIVKSLYVDDLCAGEFDEDAAFQFFKGSKEILEKGQFNLRKWKTNSSAVSEKIVEQGEALGSDECKVLGIPWDPHSDFFFFSLGEFASKFLDMVVTKRNVVSVIAQLFDPLGLLSPIFIVAKILLQKIHKSCADWDKVAEKNLQSEWLNWLRSLIEIDTIKIHRFYFFDVDPFSRESSIELHGFSDASAEAYGAVVYVVEKTSRRSVTVTSKTRVAPLKSTSIPRLELLGAYVLSILIERVEQAMNGVVKVNGVHCWTDSMVVLYWLDSDKELKQFVRNRVNKIKKHTKEGVWRHCPGKENPSDLLTRGVTSKEDFEEGLWLRGPDWLSKDPSYWPDQKIEVDISVKESALKEVKVSNVLVAKTVVSQLIQFQRFSSYWVLVRVVAWALRFKYNFRVFHGTGLALGQRRRGSLTVEELNDAEIVILKQVQSELNNERLKELESSLGLRWNEIGLLETVGRLEEAESCSRVLIPRDSHLSALVVLQAHERVKHSGVAATLAEVRSRFWIAKGRQFVKKILKNCIVCKKLNSRAFSSLEGLLPEFRVENTVTAFENVGLDYIGPLYVVEKDSSPSERKIWVALFTCATSRAVHLELVNDMTTESFLNSFRRFCGRRGIPSQVVSDNAKTFKAANKHLLQLSKDCKVIDYFSSLRISWKFILEKSPWWGGFWERMVRLTKDSLKKTLRKANVSSEGLHTILVEIEAVLNCRPLTYVGADDEAECLTPSHLVCGKRILSLPTGKRVLSLEESYHHVRKSFNDAKERWYKEYLTELRVFQAKNKDKPKVPKVGSLVLVKDANKRRQLWNVGKVESLIVGRRGIVRGATISFGIEGKQTIKRPLELLFPLEVHGWDSFNFSGKKKPSDIPSTKSNKESSVSVEENSQPIIPAEVQNLVVPDSGRYSPIIAPSISEKSIPAALPSVPVTSPSVPVTFPSVPVTSSSDPVNFAGTSVPVTFTPVPVKPSSDPVKFVGTSVPVTFPSVPVTSSSDPVNFAGTSVPVTSSSDPVNFAGTSVPVTFPSVPVTSSSDSVNFAGTSVPVTFPSVPVNFLGPSVSVTSCDTLVPVSSIHSPAAPCQSSSEFYHRPLYVTDSSKQYSSHCSSVNKDSLKSSKLNPLAKSYSLRSKTKTSKLASSGV